jgi:hypothetical protein
VDAIRAIGSLRSGGGFAASRGEPISLGATLSALKALELLGVGPSDPDGILTFVESQFAAGTPACIDQATGAPAVLATAAGLLCLRALDATDALEARVPTGAGWMAAQAKSREEHFMTVAVVEECHLEEPPARAVKFFQDQSQADGTFGPSVLNNGIASSALLRAADLLHDPAAVTSRLLGGQADGGGFADDGPNPDLWTSYCVMRALDLLGVSPRVAALADWVMQLQLPGGGFGSAGIASADVTYQALSILDWISAPVLTAARNGDLASLQRFLASGGDPNLRDLRGWTPLMAAAVRGRAPVISLLLSDGVPGGKPADPDMRLAEADALPIFWAGQSGDIATVAAILAKRPEHVFAVSAINGHTVLLQAVFFGTQRHRDLAEWLLAGAGGQLGTPDEDPSDLVMARRTLTAASNVRGYTALTMARLWGNQALEALLVTDDQSTEEERKTYFERLLASIARPLPHDPAERASQELTDQCIQALNNGLAALNTCAVETPTQLAPQAQDLLATIEGIVTRPEFQMNRLGGPLSEPPLVAAVTGVDASPEVGRARLRIITYQLEKGADPDLPELHPMGVDAVIRAAVLNHFDILRELARFMRPLAFAAAMNVRPVINGQTALDDTVHRALTASPATIESHLEQIRWAIKHGARIDIADFTGTTVVDRAEQALLDPILGERAPAVLEALGAAISPSRRNRHRGTEESS